MAKNSRRKGKNGELEWAHWLTDRGIPARRGQQYSGTADSPDVVADHPGWHPEVKRVESLNIYDAVEKAVSEAAPGNVPYVAHRRNRKEWLVTMRAEDWLRAVAPKQPNVTSDTTAPPAATAPVQPPQPSKETPQSS